MTDDPHVAIPQLIYRYCRALDRLDTALLDQVFASDAVIELGTIFTGDPASFVPVMQDFMGSMAATRHDVSNILIERDGDRATVESYVTAWHLLRGDNDVSELIVRARYLSVAARGPNGWRLVRHGEVLDWGQLTPADDGWYAANRELPKGTRDAGDASYAVFERVDRPT